MKTFFKIKLLLLLLFVLSASVCAWNVYMIVCKKPRDIDLQCGMWVCWKQAMKWDKLVWYVCKRANFCFKFVCTCCELGKFDIIKENRIRLNASVKFCHLKFANFPRKYYIQRFPAFPACKWYSRKF
jgi:hypothetical protein